MNFHCTICYDSLVNETDTPACLSCGHTFHKSCITQWMLNKTSPACPLCKKRIVKTKMISPFYLSTNDAPVAAPVDNSSLVSMELTAKIRNLQQEKAHLSGSLDSVNRELAEKRAETQRLREEVCRAQNQRRYIKIIKKVAELDEDLSEDHIQKYLHSIQGLPAKDLLVHVGALRARQIKAIEEADHSAQRLALKIRDNDLLKAKLEKLTQRLKDSNSSAPSPPASTTNSNSNSKPKNEKAVIILDDSDEESEILNLTGENENNDDVLEFLVEEHVPRTSNSRKRRNFLDDDDSDRANKIVAIDLSQDDGYSVAGPSSRSRA